MHDGYFQNGGQFEKFISEKYHPISSACGLQILFQSKPVTHCNGWSERELVQMESTH